jgi:PAS domain S-box-containing protein
LIERTYEPELASYWITSSIYFILTGIMLTLALQMVENALLRASNEMEARKRAKDEYQALFDNNPIGIYRSSVDGRMIQANLALMRFNGYQNKEEFIASVADISTEWYVDPERRRTFQKELEEHGEVTNFESEVYRHKTRERVWISENAHPVRDSGGNIIYYEGTVEDITPRKQAENEREALIAELTAKNAELERFTYTVSHDLKSPLVTINGFLGLIERDAEQGELQRLKRDKQRVTSAVDKMAQLLDELLELSQIGRVINPQSMIPFSDLAREAMVLVEGRLQERKVHVQIQSALSNVYGDKPRLLEVLQNLFDNAAKYMGHQASPCIEVGQQGEEDGMPIFFVRDNGLGIAPEYHEKIFGLFNKLDPQSEGTGVGLALVKRIIEFHGGRIWLENNAGAGTTFKFTLPQQPVIER